MIDTQLSIDKLLAIVLFKRTKILLAIGILKGLFRCVGTGGVGVGGLTSMGYMSLCCFKKNPHTVFL